MPASKEKGGIDQMLSKTYDIINQIHSDIECTVLEEGSRPPAPTLQQAAESQQIHSN